MRKGPVNSSTNVLYQQGPANVFINQSNNHCTYQMPGTVTEVLALKGLCRKGPTVAMHRQEYSVTPCSAEARLGCGGDLKGDELTQKERGRS